MTNDIEIQKKQVLGNQSTVELVSACRVGEGIIRLTDEQKERSLTAFGLIERIPAFFIPASGSGSRMFQFLFEWLESGNEEQLDRLRATLECTALELDGENNRELVEKLVAKYAALPKGLIPFHSYENQVRTAFQEHLEQVKELFPAGADLHFTIQKSAEEAIRRNLGELKQGELTIDYSYQNEATDAYCFTLGGELAMDGAKVLRRPSGHGALLENLNAIDSDLIFIKNIDNVQHASKSALSSEVWKQSAGLLMNFKADLKTLSEDFSLEAMRELNVTYQFLSNEELERFTADDFERILKRPIRVCGMVKNEGEPGGGPFWIKDGDTVTKQIIEKAQIASDSAQQEIVNESSHFNPVFIVVSKQNAVDEHLDLLEFRDDSKYFVVEKSHKGQPIRYRELPGLWNGSMANWNTLFLEIPSEVFSPVKTVLDLAKPAHQQ